MIFTRGPSDIYQVHLPGMSVFTGDDALRDAAASMRANGFQLDPEDARSLEVIIVAAMSSLPEMDVAQLACWAKVFRDLSLITPPPDAALIKDLFGTALPLFCQTWDAVLKEERKPQTPQRAAMLAAITVGVFNAIHSFKQSGPASLFKTFGLLTEDGQQAVTVSSQATGSPALWRTVTEAFFYLPRCYKATHGGADVPISSLSWLASQQVFAWLAAVAEGGNKDALQTMSVLMDSPAVCRRVVQDNPRLLLNVTRHAAEHWGDDMEVLENVADMLKCATFEEGNMSPGQVVELLGIGILTPLARVRARS